MTNPSATEIKRLFGLLIVLFLLGLSVGHVALVLLVGLAAYLGWHLTRLFRLESWLRTGTRGDPPDARGIWGEVFDQIYRLQQRHRRRKQNLQSIVARFQESTSAMPDATVVLDAQAHINWFNKAAHRLLGLRLLDKGQRIDNLIRQPVFTAYLSAGDYNEPVEMVSPVDENIVLSVRIVPYGNDQRLLIARDVTRLQRLERVRRDFVTNVSHELRTPLTVLSGYLESLEGENLDEHVSQALRLMEQQTTRMRHIVEDLLLLSRLETGHPSDDMHPVAVPALLKRMREDAQALSGENNHTVALDADDSLYLRGNEKEIYSAFSNLVYNAVKYTPKNGHIRMRWKADDRSVCFSVEDDGIGISPHHIPRLTERFYRVDVGRSRDKGGTGLGLAIVKHVVHRHDGHLRIHSDPGAGSVFTCQFPTERAIRK